MAIPTGPKRRSLTNGRSIPNIFSTPALSKMRSHPNAMRYEGARRRAKMARFQALHAAEFVRRTIHATTRAIAVAKVEETTPMTKECQIDRKKYGSAAALKLLKVNHSGPWSRSLGLKATARKRRIGRTRMLTMTNQKIVIGEIFVRAKSRALEENESLEDSTLCIKQLSKFRD